MIIEKYVNLNIKRDNDNWHDHLEKYVFLDFYIIMPMPHPAIIKSTMWENWKFFKLDLKV